MFDCWEKFDRRILYRVVWKLYKQIKSYIFVADFTRFAFAGFHFLWGSLVVIRPFLVFKLFINFDRSVTPEVWLRSLQNIILLWHNFGSVASVPTAKLNLGLNFTGFVNESFCDWLKNLGWPRLKYTENHVEYHLILNGLGHRSS